MTLHPNIIRLEAEAATGASADRSVDVVCSTEAVNCYGYRVDQSGWDLARFQRNPVVLFDHGQGSDGNMPIGKASNVRIEDGQLKATLTFASAAVSPIADRCLAAFREGVLNAVSVGFQPLDLDEDEDGTLVVRRAELWEISVVAVPADPGALREQTLNTLSALRLAAAQKETAMRTKTAKTKVKHSADDQANDDTKRPDEEQSARLFAVEDEVIVGEKPGKVAEIAEGTFIKVAFEDGSVAWYPEGDVSAPGDGPVEAEQVTEELKALTGAKTLAAALGIVAAGKAALEELAALRSKQGDEQRQSDKATADRERAELIAKLSAEKRLSPAQKTWAQTVDLAALKSFAEVAPVITALAATKTTEPAKDKTKRWEDYSHVELAALSVDNPELYTALKADRDQRAAR